MKSLTLYNSLILSDFSIITSQKKNCYFNKRVVIDKKNSISILDLPYLVTSLKQLLKILMFLKTFPESLLEIVVLNKLHYYLLKDYFKTVSLKSSVKLNFISSLSYSQKKLQPLIAATLILDSDGILNGSLSLQRFTVDSKFLIQTINAKLESQNRGFYKMFNDLNDFKKILYLSVLIEKTLR